MIRITALILAALSLVAPAKAAIRKPNFLFIITDDQRWDAMGMVQREQGDYARFPWFQTPNMDRLAADGIRFRNAFVTLSLCSPSRAAFLTGRYNHLNGVVYNSRPLPDDSVTHATLLGAAGYQTAYFGKWHMGMQRGQRPGFGHSASFVGQGNYIDCAFEIDGVPTPTKGWVDDVSTDFAIEWMKRKSGTPFSMVVGFKSPHSPRGGDNLPDRLRNLYEGKTSREVPNSRIKAIYHNPKKEGELGGLSANPVHLDYLRHVKGADENLGRLLDTLDELGIADDTVVVYTSDNGYFLGEHGLGDKRALYEESLRIPMLLRYPRLFKKGQLIDEMVLNIDLAPTFLDLAGVAIPAEMQGASWKGLASGGNPQNWRKSFLSEYFEELGDTPTCIGVRTAGSKLVRYTDRPEWTEAFDLIKDPYEVKNLAADPDAAKELEAELEAQLKAMKYEVPFKALKGK
jgi:arylsulfatase A-like enzyme